MTSHSSEPMLQKWVLGWILPLVIGGMGLATIAAMGKSKPKQVPTAGTDPISRLTRLPVIYAKTVLPFKGSRNLDIDVTGVVVPYRQVTLAAEVSGRVAYKSDACRIGRFVEEGELLFKLDATDYQLEVERLAALRDSEYAQQKELNQEVANAQRSMELAEQDVSLQEKELERLEKLPAGFASATELDQARRLRLTASTQRLTIQNQLQMLESRRTRIELGERLVATQLAQAKVNLARTEIRAPLAGVIVSEMAEVASYLQKGATLCVIHDTQRVEVSCNLRADQLMHVLDQREDSIKSLPLAATSADSYKLPPTPVTVEYRVVGRDDSVLQWQGTLSRYEGIGIDAQSRTIPVRITVEDPRQIRRNGKPIAENGGGSPPALVQGMFVDCQIHTSPKRPMILIPQLALRPGNQVWKFVADPSLLSEPVEGKPLDGGVASATDEPTTATDASAIKQSSLRVEDWTAGRIEIISNVRSIRSIALPEQNGEEYWICEAAPKLEPGTRLVVSPMANMIGNGQDKARLQNSSMKDESTNP